MLLVQPTGMPVCCCGDWIKKGPQGLGSSPPTHLRKHSVPHAKPAQIAIHLRLWAKAACNRAEAHRVGTATMGWRSLQSWTVQAEPYSAPAALKGTQSMGDFMFTADPLFRNAAVFQMCSKSSTATMQCSDPSYGLTLTAQFGRYALQHTCIAFLPLTEYESPCMPKHGRVPSLPN